MGAVAVSTVSVRSVTVVAVSVTVVALSMAVVSVSVSVVSVSVGSVTVVAVAVTVSVMSVMTVVNTAVATVNNTVVVKIFLKTALSMSAVVLLSEASAISMGAGRCCVMIVLEAALSMSAVVLLSEASAISVGAGWCCVMIVLKAALSVSAVIMAEIVMKIMITVVSFVEVTTVSVVVLLSEAPAISVGAGWCCVSVIILGSVGVFVNEMVGTAVGSESTLVIEVSKLIELGSAGEETISAGVSEATDIVHNALTSFVISGSIKNFVI